jgi:hypothetical protein
MAFYHINQIAQGLREYDNNSHPVDNYKFFSWKGLEDESMQNGYITQNDLNNFASLTTLIHNDEYSSPCDQ